MAIVHADNFSIYGTQYSLLTEGVYADISSMSIGSITVLPTDPDGLSPGRVLRLVGAAGDGRLRCVLPTNASVLGVSVRLWMDGLPTKMSGLGSSYPAIWLLDGGNVALYSLTVDTTGRIQIRNSAGNVIYTTTNPVLSAKGWWHIEWKTVRDSTTGSFEVRVEGIPVIQETNLNTGTVDFGQVSIGCAAYGSGGNYSFHWKDYVLWDGAGSTNNNFIGSVIVHNLMPTSDVDLNWTPSAGATGYTILDNIPPTSDYIYAEDDPLPSPYVATLSDLPPEVTSIKALVTYVRAAKNDGGDGSLQVGLISDPDGTPATSLGADRPITVAQTYWKDVHEIDPATSAPWLPDAVNQVQLQINRTT